MRRSKSPFVVVTLLKLATLISLMSPLSCHHPQSSTEQEIRPPKSVPLFPVRPKRRPRFHVEQRVHEVLDLAGLGSVSVNVNPDTGHVALIGDVKSSEEKEKLLLVVKALRGVRQVEDQLTIRKPPIVSASIKSEAVKIEPNRTGFWDQLYNNWIYLLSSVAVGLGIYLTASANFWRKRYTEIRAK